METIFFFAYNHVFTSMIEKTHPRVKGKLYVTKSKKNSGETWEKKKRTLINLYHCTRQTFVVCILVYGF